MRPACRAQVPDPSPSSNSAPAPSHDRWAEPKASPSAVKRRGSEAGARKLYVRCGLRRSMPMPVGMSIGRPVADRRRWLGCRQLLPGLLQPALIPRRIHDTGRPPAREHRLAGNQRGKNDRAARQNGLHVGPAKSTRNSHAKSVVTSWLDRMSDAGRFAKANQVDRHPDRLEPDAATPERCDLKCRRRMSGSRRRHSRSGGPGVVSGACGAAQ